MTGCQGDRYEAISASDGQSSVAPAESVRTESSRRRWYRWILVGAGAVGVLVLILCAEMLTTPVKPMVKTTPPAPAAIPPATLKRLQALGYLTAPRPTPATKPKATSQPSSLSPQDGAEPAPDAPNQ